MWIRIGNTFMRCGGGGTPIVDADGNIYTSIIIDTQEWMVENLKVTHYADGTAIPTGLTEAQWAAENGTSGHDGSYCWANNDINRKVPYGALYNCFAVKNAHGLAPAGWKVPSYGDVKKLVFYAGSDLQKLKEAGTTHWASPNAATDDYGWKALPTGDRYLAGIYQDINPAIGAYLTRSLYTSTWQFYYIFQNQDGLFRYEAENGKMGSAVRCMRYTAAEISKERIGSLWCAVGAVPNFWNDTDGTWSTDGTKLIGNGTGTYIGNVEHLIAYPEVVHVKITVALTSGEIIPPWDGTSTPPATITTSGAYEYDLDYTGIAGLNWPGLYMATTSFVGNITALSVKGKFE